MYPCTIRLILYHDVVCRESLYSNEFNFFLRGRESMRVDAKVPQIKGFTKTQVRFYRLTNLFYCFI